MSKFLFCVAQRSPQSRWQAEVLLEQLAWTAKNELQAVARVPVGWRSRWVLTHHAKAPTTPGCYAIYRGARLVYIGSTRNLQQRLAAHWADTSRWKATRAEPLSVKIKHSRKIGDWLMIEYRLILRLQPEHNCTFTDRKPKRSLA